MTTSHRLLTLAAAISSVLLAPACGSSAPPTSSSSLNSSFHGAVTDPAGDAVLDSRVTTSPDLIRGTAEVVAGGNITFTIRVAAGTFNPVTTRFTVVLNTDQNVSTGTGTLGVEYFLQMGGILGNRADVVKSGDEVAVGFVPAHFVTDGIDITVPLALLGNDDGRMNFKVFASAGPAWPTVLDHMPDEGLPPGRVQ